MGKSSDQLIKAVSAAIESGDLPKAEICRRCGFSASQLDAYLKRTSTPGLDAADKLADALGSSLWSLLKEGATPEGEPWSSVPRQLLIALSLVHPSHHPIILNFLESFTVEREASKIAKGLQESRGSRKKRSK